MINPHSIIFLPSTACVIPKSIFLFIWINISQYKLSDTDCDTHSSKFFDKMKSMGDVRLPGERRHKNRLDKGPRHINEDLVNKIKSLS